MLLKCYSKSEYAKKKQKNKKTKSEAKKQKRENKMKKIKIKKERSAIKIYGALCVNKNEL